MDRSIKQRLQLKKLFLHISIDYPDRGLSNEQINDEVIFKNYQPSLLWVKAKASFGEIMWMPIYDSNKDQWASTEDNTKNKNKK